MDNIQQKKMKEKASLAALEYIKQDIILGVGTGSTVSYFIKNLIIKKKLIKSIVSSSIESTNKLLYLNLPILNANNIDSIDLYVDGADEFNSSLMLIKGGKAALTREKILASMAKQFIVIADESKQVDILGHFPLPIEVIPMACSYVMRKLIQLGGIPKYRQNVITDNGNIIIDVYNLKIKDPINMENYINTIDGVVTVGLFANRTADIILLATSDGLEKITL